MSENEPSAVQTRTEQSTEPVTTMRLLSMYTRLLTDYTVLEKSKSTHRRLVRLNKFKLAEKSGRETERDRETERETERQRDRTDRQLETRSV